MKTSRQEIIIDARGKDSYNRGHLEDAINIPVKEIIDNGERLREQVPEQNQPIIVYCRGGGCGTSRVFIKTAQELGYTNITHFEGGITEWKEKGYYLVIEFEAFAPKDGFFCAIKDKEDDHLIDLRSESSYNKGHIPTAINLPRAEFIDTSGTLINQGKTAIEKIPQNKKDSHHYLYSDNKEDSMLGAKGFELLNYPNIYRIQEGWEKWVQGDYNIDSCD
jgi:rhodanese-related sulfurtransferase